MPSTIHEILIELFRREPSLAGRLLRHASVEVPAHGRVELVDTAIRDLLPPEARADLILLYQDDAPVFAAVIEIQLGRDDDKPYRWPSYLTSVRERHRCPVAVVVVALDESVAEWAKKPLQLGPGAPWRPVVLGPRDVPRIDEVPPEDRTAAHALLSAAMHIKKPKDLNLGPLVLDEKLPGLDEFGGWKDYGRCVLSVLPRLIRQLAMEGKMPLDLEGIEAPSDIWERRGIEKGLAQGLATGRREGRLEGRHEGRHEGRLEGRLEAAREHVLRGIHRRGWRPTDAHRERIESCTDLERLEGWLDRLFDAHSLDEALN